MEIKKVQKEVYTQLLTVESEREAKSLTNILLEHYTGFDTLKINLSPQSMVEKSTLETIFFAVEELKQHKPVQYVLNQAFFAGKAFYVDKRVLIPRPETEELFFWILSENKEIKGNLIDICTGSGCLAVSLALRYSLANVLAVDISKDALEVAFLNAKNNHAEVCFSQQDILSADFDKFENNKQFNFIVSNPPYVRLLEKEYMHSRVLNHEPHEALFVSNENPLLFYHSIASWAKKRLSKGGLIYMEINENLANETINIFKSFDFTEIKLKKDIHGKNRMLRAIK